VSAFFGLLVHGDSIGTPQGQRSLKLIVMALGKGGQLRDSAGMGGLFQTASRSASYFALDFA